MRHLRSLHHTSLFLLIPTWLALQSLAAQGQSDTFGTLVPVDNRSEMKVFLHTVGRGILLPELYGHTQLRILDEKSGRDIVVSWGLYDFKNPWFFWEFFKGTAEYLTSAFPASATFRYYQLDQRPVWEDELSLSTRQKHMLVDLLDINLEQENREYVYHIYADNCSTRLRDLINELTHDSLRLATSGKSANTSVREVMRFHQSAIPYSSWFLDVIGSGMIDADMSVWDKMFLPLGMREALLDFVNPETGEHLASPSRTVVEGKETSVSVSRELCLEIILAFLLAASCWISPYSRDEVRSLIYYPALALRYSAAYMSAFMGIVLLADEFVSGHSYLKGNWNLFVFLATDFLLVHLERFKKSYDIQSGFARIFNILLMARMAFPLVLLSLWVTGVVHQDLSRTLLLQGIPMAIWCWRILTTRT